MVYINAEETKRVDFGVVKKYFPDRGFGFVSHTFANTHSKDVFFHISKIKIKLPELAKKLNSEKLIKPIYFWYEFEEPNKGDQVNIVIESKKIRQQCAYDLPVFVEKIELMWKNIDLIIPSWLNDLTIDLVGDVRTHELISEREILLNAEELKIKKKEEKVCKEEEASQEIEEEKTEKIKTEQRIQPEIEDIEFEQLVTEMTPLDFILSSQVSSYIMKNNLGYKYKNISGILTMAKDGREWAFDGGFPPVVYARLCSRLGLSNNGSDAIVVGFDSFKKIYKT